MKKVLHVVIFVAVVVAATIACELSSPLPITPTFDSGFLETAIVGTSQAAQRQTQIAIPLPSATFVPTSTPIITQTPTYPISLIYEGLTNSCVCTNCYCVTSVMITAKITIDAQGNITGTVDKYLSDTPPLNFEGTKEKIYGLLERKNDKTIDIKEEKIEFLGSLSDGFYTLECTISTSGIYYKSGEYFSAKRTALLFKK